MIRNSKNLNILNEEKYFLQKYITGEKRFDIFRQAFRIKSQGRDYPQVNPWWGPIGDKVITEVGSLIFIQLHFPSRKNKNQISFLLFFLFFPRSFFYLGEKVSKFTFSFF